MKSLGMSIQEWSDYVRNLLGLPASREPLPDVMPMDEPNTKETDEVLVEPPAPIATISEYADYTGVSYWTPATLPSLPNLAGWTSYRFNYSWGMEPEEIPEDSAPFETNMVEALVGWRAYVLDWDKKALRSQNNFFSDDEWHLLRPGKAVEAHCWKQQIGQPSIQDPAGILPPVAKHAVPAEFCTCGIYAKDTLEQVMKDGYKGIYAQVYGWGRYVRGDEGWRAQFTYPKRFYLTRNYANELNPDVIDFLRTYNVPIYVEQPVLLYNPEEDGYEHRSDEENWSFGASAEPDAEED